MTYTQPTFAKPIRSFAEAEAHLAKSPYFGSKTTTSVREYTRQNLKHIAFKLYDTDVVTYREDNAVIIQRYASMTTNAFAEQLTPNHVWSHFATDKNTYAARSETTNPWRFDVIQCDNLEPEQAERTDGVRWWDSDNKRVYRMKRNTILLTQDRDGAYYPPDPDQINPWVVPILDKSKARAALKESNYHAFMDWARVFTHMEYGKYLKYHSRSARIANRTHHPDERLHNLGEQQNWDNLVSDSTYWPTEPSGGKGFAGLASDRYNEALEADAQGYTTRRHCEALGQALRLALYRQNPGCLREVSTPFLANMRAVEANLKSCLYYGIDGS